MKELTRLLDAGPPVYLKHDKDALPVPEGDTHIANIWFMDGDETISAKLDGAVEGEEREQLWEQLRQFLVLAKDKTEEEGEGDGAASAE